MQKTIELKEYIVFSRSTAIYPEANTGSVGELMYLSLGLAGEVGELANDTPGGGNEGELGDIAYYWARIIDAMGAGDPEIDILDMYAQQGTGHAVHLENEMIDLMASVGGICNTVKKLYRDGYSVEVREKIWPNLALVVQGWADICILMGLNPADVLAANREKLSGRKERGTLGGSGENR